MGGDVPLSVGLFCMVGRPLWEFPVREGGNCYARIVHRFV